MRFDSVIDLIENVAAVDDEGFRTTSVSGRKTIFAQKGSIKSNEFYAASQSGYELELMFEIYALEFDGQKFLEYQSKLYKIIRTYEKGKTTELMCQAYMDSPHKGVLT